MRELNLLPAIFFLKSRMDCDQALKTCMPVRIKANEKSMLAKDVQVHFLKIIRTSKDIARLGHWWKAGWHPIMGAASILEGPC